MAPVYTVLVLACWLGGASAVGGSTSLLRKEADEVRLATGNNVESALVDHGNIGLASELQHDEKRHHKKRISSKLAGARVRLESAKVAFRSAAGATAETRALAQAEEALAKLEGRSARSVETGSDTINWQYEHSTYSQNGEDGIIQRICDIVGCRAKTYVEFGTQQCNECNTRALREKGWKGLLLDGSFENATINLHKEWITPGNIVSIFHKYKVPRNFDALSVDVDGIDFYVLRSILCTREFSPKMLVVEYNSHIPSTQSPVVTPLTDPPFTCTGYCNGMNLAALKALGNKFGYELIYAMSNGVNAFLVKKDALPAGFVVPSLRELDRPRTYLSEGPKGWYFAQHRQGGASGWDYIENGTLLNTCAPPAKELGSLVAK